MTPGPYQLDDNINRAGLLADASDGDFSKYSDLKWLRTTSPHRSFFAIFSTTSYNNNEITWGEFFDEDVVLFRRQEGVREEDFFNLASFGQEDIDQVETDSKDITPLLSARALAESKK